MNILFLDSVDPKTYGGMEEWIRLVASGLAKRGHTVSVCGRKESEFLRRIKSADNLSLIALAISGDFNPVTISRIRKEIEQRNIDIVVTNFNKDIRLGGLAAKLHGSPKVIWSAGLDITKDSMVHRQLTPRLIDSVIVPSKALAKQVCKFGYINEAMVEVIPIGIPELPKTAERDKSRRLLCREFGIPSDAIIAVTSGRFVEQKGHSYLLSAIPEILRKHANTFFLLLGSGPLEDELRDAGERCKLNGHLIFAGMRDKVDEILTGCDLMIHPSIEEPFGISILEGMRASLPVVASDVGGIPEVVSDGKTATLIEPRNASLLAKAVCDLLEDQSKMMAFGRSGRKRWQEEFNESTMIDRVEIHCESVLRREGVRGSS